jgi:hypothetical protein
MADPAIIVQLAEAVKAQIAAGDWSQAFVLERSYADWTLALDEPSDQPRVDVVPNGTQQLVDQTTFDGRLSYTLSVDIAVRYKFGPDKQQDDDGRIELAEIDKLMILAQELWENLPPRLDTMTNAVYSDAKILAHPDKKSLRDLRQFLSAFRLVFEVDRGVP